MNETPNLKLPYLMPSQAQKHVTHNEALGALDAIVQLAVQSRQIMAPPGSPSEGERYIVAGPAEAAWSGREGEIAAFQNGGWAFRVPGEGWLAWVADEGKLHVFTDGAWKAYASGLSSVNPVDLVGVNATADQANRLAVRSEAVLFSHDEAPSSGDIRAKLNKAAAADTATFVFQTAYSGRAEIGLAGDDDFHFKVSADGANWKEGLKIDAASGAVSLPAGRIHAASGKRVSGLIQLPGGAGEVTVWDNPVTRAGLPRASTIASVSGDLITISEANADQSFDNANMQGCAYVRIWNMSKSPHEAAWVRAIGSASQFYVKDAGAIAGWMGGETIQVGEPVGAVDGLNTTDDIVAIDVSQMLQKMTGEVFRQDALQLGVGFSTTGAIGWDAHVAVTPNGAGGSFFAIYTAVEGASTSAMIVASTTQPSPISDSNLLLIRERTANGGLLAGASVRVKGVYV